MGKNSLYTISNDIYGILSFIEENDGEITDEIKEQLSIKKDELLDKLDSYRKAIIMFNNYADECKNEKKRINDIQNVWKNRSDRLKSAMQDAVEAFGMPGRSGNKVVETATMKLYTRTQTIIETDTERINLLTNSIHSVLKTAYQNDCLVTGPDFNPDDFLEAINNAANEKCCIENFQPFTIEDLETLSLKFETSISIIDWMHHCGGTIKDYAKFSNKDINLIADGTLSTAVKEAKSELGDKLTVANTKLSTSLIMK